MKETIEYKGWTIRYPGRGVADPKKKFLQALGERKKNRATS
jgi:hypothetical protein